MTKEEAKEQMRAGKKVTHRYFTIEEWVTMEDGRILLEDGVRCSEHEFWAYRTSKSFDDDWSIWLDKCPACFGRGKEDNGGEYQDDICTVCNGSGKKDW